MKGIEERIRDLLQRVEEELGIGGALIFAEGSAECSDCIRIETHNEESFVSCVSALLRQAVTSGTLPIIIVKSRGLGEVRFYAIDTVNRVIISLIRELRY